MTHPHCYNCLPCSSTADAELKKAEAIKATRNAQAESLATLLATFGNRPELALYYVSMENGLYDRMAAQTAAAVQVGASTVKISEQ